jgi:hypothetical protein
VKSGKVAGFDGVYPELIDNSGQRTKEWIVAGLKEKSDILDRLQTSETQRKHILFGISIANVDCSSVFLLCKMH